MDYKSSLFIYSVCVVDHSLDLAIFPITESFSPMSSPNVG